MIRSVADCTAFLAEYHRGWGVEPRLADDDVPDHFPPPLWRVYRDLGGLFDAGTPGKRPLGTQDQLVPPDDVTFEDGQAIIAWENQGNWSARTACGPAAADDPPVEFDAGEMTEDLFSDADRPAVHGPGGLPLASRSLADWLITFLLREAVMSSPSVAADMTPDPPEDPRKWAAAPLSHLWTDGPLFPDGPVAGGRGHDFYTVGLSAGGGPALLMRHPHEGLWLGRHGGDATAVLTPDASHTAID